MASHFLCGGCIKSRHENALEPPFLRLKSFPCRAFCGAYWNKSCFCLGRQRCRLPAGNLGSHFYWTIKDMPSFAYTARETATGREIRNSVEAATEQAAIAALLNRNLLVVSIQERISRRGRTKGGKVSLGDLVMFTRQLATMVDAGIAIVQSLQALADQTANKVMRDTIHDVCTRVEGGESFSEALQKHPKAFNRLYVSMVAAGEKGGVLAEILARLATYLENSDRLRKKVKTALMYPSAVTVVAICITTFLLVKVIPTFKDIYSGFNAKLPGPTEFMIGISEIVQHYLVVFIAGAVALVWGWFYFIKTKTGREFWEGRRIK